VVSFTLRPLYLHREKFLPLPGGHYTDFAEPSKIVALYILILDYYIRDGKIKGFEPNGIKQYLDLICSLFLCEYHFYLLLSFQNI
jgi:hypothetical protein